MRGRRWQPRGRVQAVLEPLSGLYLVFVFTFGLYRTGNGSEYRNDETRIKPGNFEIGRGGEKAGTLFQILSPRPKRILILL